jgi:hypothetical protein
MLMLDRRGVSNREPEEIIASCCSPFGYATVIRVLAPDDRREYGIAAVKMRSCEEALRIARKFGDAQLGSIVLIRLIQHSESGRRSKKDDRASGAGRIAPPAVPKPAAICRTRKNSKAGAASSCGPGNLRYA